MARKPSRTLTDAELRIMEVLWERGEATVREVTDVLARKHKLAYTTVLTVMRILAEKKVVAARADARAHVFRPLVSRSQARSRALGQMLRAFFGGSPEALAQHLIESKEIDLKRLRAIEAAFEAKVGDD